MNRIKIEYSKLNSRAQENYNCAKFAALMADYGYTCLRLSDDWNGADLLALGTEGDTLRVQVKGRMTIDSKYAGKDVWMAFPDRGNWYLVEHDLLRDMLMERDPNSVVTHRHNAGQDYFRSMGRLPQWALTALQEYKV